MDFSDPAQLAACWTVHSDLPREGPGDRAGTARALALAQPLPPAPQLLDVACGPGAQTLDLAKLLPDAQITALDFHEPFLRELERRAADKGISDRIRAIHGDMAALSFAPASFDLIWCEGAAYIMGVEAALAAWRPLLRPGGVLAFSEAVWLSDDPSVRAQACWAEYPEMGRPEDVRAKAGAAGYRVRGDFVLGREAWWTYYRPLEARLARLEQEAAREVADPALRLVLAEVREEVEVRRHHGDSYGYLFMVLEA